MTNLQLMQHLANHEPMEAILMTAGGLYAVPEYVSVVVVEGVRYQLIHCRTIAQPVMLPAEEE